MQKTQHQLLLTTCPNLQLSQKIANLLIKQKLAACVNILPQTQSIYEWKGEIVNDNEEKYHFLLFFLTHYFLPIGIIK